MGLRAANWNFERQMTLKERRLVQQIGTLNENFDGLSSFIIPQTPNDGGVHE